MVVSGDNCRDAEVVFGKSVNPIQTRGADYAPPTTATPPGFKQLSTPLLSHVEGNLKAELLIKSSYYIVPRPNCT